MFALPITALIAAKWIEKYSKSSWSKLWLFFATMGTYVLVKLVSFLPVLGWVAVFLLVCTSFGAVIMTTWEHVQKVR